MFLFSLNTVWAETASGLISVLLFYNQRNRFLITWWISKYPLQHWYKGVVTSRSRCDQIKIERSSSETTIKFTLHIIEPKNVDWIYFKYYGHHTASLLFSKEKSTFKVRFIIVSVRKNQSSFWMAGHQGIENWIKFYSTCTIKKPEI